MWIILDKKKLGFYHKSDRVIGKVALQAAFIIDTVR